MSEEHMNPPVETPASAMVPGMAAALVFDSSLPGPSTQPGPPRPPAWSYDFDPATGQARATFDGEVLATTISTPAAGVSAFNGRTGSVSLETTDLSALDALFNPSPALAGTPTTPTAPPGDSSQTVASTQFVTQAVAAGAGVVSFNARQGAITLTLGDVTNAGGAPSASPALTGNPTAPTPPATDASSSVATTQYVQNVVAGQAVVSFNGRRGVVNLTLGDVTSVGGAPLASPAFTGSPTSTNPPVGDATTRIATTEFVTNAITGAATGVVSFNTRQGAVTLQTADIAGVGGALLAGPVFTGQPEAPTPPANDASTRLATTEFVETAIGSMAPLVTSFNTRTGAVSLQLADVTTVGGAPLASPTFTGTPQTTAPAPGDSSSRIPTTSWVDAAIAALPANVASFNGRTGAVSLTTTDVTGAGGATAAQLAGYLPLGGGTLSGSLTIEESASTFALLAQSPQNQIVFGPSGGTSAVLTMAGGNLTIAGLATTISTLLLNAGVYELEGSINCFPQGIAYSGLGGNNSIAFLWTGTNLGAYVNGAWVGDLSLSTSDASLKENFAAIAVDPLAVLDKVPLQQFDWKPITVGNETLQRPHASCGFTAQDIEALIPEAASGEEGRMSIDLLPLIAYCIGAIQQLTARIAELEARSAAK